MTAPDPIEAELEKPENRSYRQMVERVRLYMRDYGPLNRLVKNQESSTRDIVNALEMTIDDINSTPPPRVKTLDQMLAVGWGPLVVLGTTLSLLRTVALVHIRNHLPFNDGGMATGGLHDRYGPMLQWVSLNEGRYENLKKQVKVSDNLSAMMGSSPSGVPSEYSLLGGSSRF
jgi:hypothetical protein